MLVADTGDPASLREMAAGTRVLASTVGPYRRYGIPVVQACAEAGTHYADLTGEVVFMRESIDAFDAAARGSGARIVHTCGFDSIPSDIGVLLLHERAAADGAGALGETELVVRSFRGGVSGGTFASMRGMIDDRRRDPALGRMMDDPYALSPDRGAEPDLGPEKDLAGVERDRLAGGWVGPVRDGAGEHPRRAPQQRPAGLGLRSRDALPRGDGLRRRTARAGARSGRRGGVRRDVRRDAVGPDGVAHEPRGALARRGPERARARERLLPHRDAHAHKRRAGTTSAASPPTATPATRRPP